MNRAARAISLTLSLIALCAGQGRAAEPVRPQPSATFPPHGGAYLTSLPANASAWLDGMYVGSTPVYVDDLLPGEHSITLSAAGWQPQTSSFAVVVGRITPVSLIMERNPSDRSTSGQGAIALAGAPPGSHVFVDGASLGTTPIDPHPEASGYHIVTLQPPGPSAPRSTRVVDVFPGATTTVSFAPPSAAVLAPEDDVLEPVDAVVPDNGIAIAGGDVTIHFRDVEIECTIGSRAYTYNGKPSTMTISPALVAGKIYLPRSLLQRIAGQTAAQATGQRPR